MNFRKFQTDFDSTPPSFSENYYYYDFFLMDMVEYVQEATNAR